MKKTIIILAAAGLALSSCSESFLDVSSKTESTTGNFYQTESDAYRALLGCYDGWRQVSSKMCVGFYIASTIMGDECYAGVGTGDARNYQAIDRFDISEAPSYSGTLYGSNDGSSDWGNYYAAVYRCNELITHDEQIAWTSEATRQLYLGEARGLRALCYFDMVRLWGNIPLFLEPVDENRPQADPSEVYEAIFDDLKFAIENIPADAYPKSQASSNDGHVTKFAAEAILARAYLFYSGYYGQEPTNCTKAEALAACEDVIANSGCELVEDFKTLWAAASLVPIEGEKGWDSSSTYAGEANSEVILQMKFTGSQDYNGNNDSNRWQVMMGIRNINFSPYGKGWGACTVCPTFLEKFQSGDKRLEASVIDLEGEGVTKLETFQNSHYKDQREYTGYTVKKYSPLAFSDGTSASLADGSGDFQITNPQNWVIVRLADVYLMAAELGSSRASEYLNAVHHRAGLTDNLAVTKENIMNERALELAFEGHRYWDLLRQGIDVAAETIAASSGMTYSGGAEDYVTISADRIRATKGLSQIPGGQITLSNGTLVQNAGW
ncbi:MAG: RagB/SusD family nutrient uptake outer membrane protein [Bacteroidales bacterium]|nr:RagB/SusD family nutrient uptake outer membrane protein [Bacteroidales bacterium]